MPVTGASQPEVYVIVGITTDVMAPSLEVTFSKRVGGVEINQIHYPIVGDSFNAIFGTPGDGTTPRGVDLNQAIYNSAVSAGIMSGTITADA